MIDWKELIGKRLLLSEYPGDDEPIEAYPRELSPDGQYVCLRSRMTGMGFGEWKRVNMFHAYQVLPPLPHPSPLDDCVFCEDITPSKVTMRFGDGTTEEIEI
jgi:hypothetical protein